MGTVSDEQIAAEYANAVLTVMKDWQNKSSLIAGEQEFMIYFISCIDRSDRWGAV